MAFPAEPCPDCPREAHGWPAPCPAQLHPERHWCRYAADWSDPEAVTFLCGLGPEPSHAPRTASLPLAGDLVEAAAHRLGADRLAQWVATQLGKDDCGCQGRRDRLNALDARLRRYLGFPAAAQ